MSYTERRIVESYSDLLEGLRDASKMEIIENLSRSMKAEKKSKDKAFYKSFGAFASDKSAEEIVKEIRSSRKFTALRDCKSRRAGVNHPIKKE